MSKTNHVRIVGNIGQIPSIITSTSGTKILSFTVASHDRIKNDGGTYDTKTEWHNLVAFGNIANLISEHLTKGSQAMFLGRLCTRQYTDKAGNPRYVTEIIVEDVLFLGSSKKD